MSRAWRLQQPTGLGLPGGALYHATKHALEACGDLLRMEVAQFGVRVSLIELAAVRTQFFAMALMRFAGQPESRYQEFYDKLATWAVAVHEGRTSAGRFAVPPEKVAAAIERAVRSRRPKARYPVGPLARGALTMRRLMPDAVFDGFVARQFPARKR